MRTRTVFLTPYFRKIRVKHAAPDSAVIAACNLHAFKKFRFNKGSDNLQEV